MNRKDRRKANKALPAYKRQSPAQQMASLVQNGITPEYVDRECEKAKIEGYTQGVEATMGLCYAAACLALNELHGFGHKRCKKFLSAMDYHVVYTLTTFDAMDEVFKRMGLKINLKGMEHIEEV